MMNEHAAPGAHDDDGADFSSATLDEILALLQAQSGVDFRSYRRTTIERRLLARMSAVGVASFDAYLGHLRHEPAELDHLTRHLTIKVSRFFRNAAVFDLLRQIVQGDLLRRGCAEPLRAWSAGCANGEEAYSLAILLAEVGADQQGAGARVYATDIDEKALTAAGVGSYPREALDEMPPEMIDRYFTQCPWNRGVHYAVRADLKSLVEFLPHDLTTETSAPSGLRFDLICCRNVLIYFDQALQARVLRLLYNSLTPGGYLCLGEAEWLVPSVRELFDVVDRSCRVFQMRAGAGN